MTTTEPDASETIDAREHTDRIVTVPNAITASRVAGTFVLVYMAHRGWPEPFIWLLVVLVFTDWLDGKIATVLDQRSIFGARLDSFADVFLNGCLVLCASWLRPDFIERDRLLLVAILVIYGVSVLISIIRFHRTPSLHSRLAKMCWFLIAVGAIILFAGGPLWPIRVALFAVIVVNIEEIAITLTLPRWRADVPSIFHARAIRRRTTGDI